jgi:hypothetical protein
MNELQLSIEVREVAKRFAASITECRRSEAEEVRQTALRMQPMIARLWQSTMQRLDPYLTCGSPCSIMNLAGLGELEKPFNRLLLWCADERGPHGFGREFLLRLSAHLHFDRLSEDLAGGKRVDLWGEEAPDSSGNMPDLVVLTPNAALLFENKVNAGGSGDQYANYEHWFPSFAGDRERRAVLSAPSERETPPGWDQFLAHEELAAVFSEIAGHSSVPTWGRIIAIQCATALDEPARDSIADLVYATRHAGRAGLRDWQTVLAFRPSSKTAKPWETK